MDYIKDPGLIEKRSFEIISEELGNKINDFNEEELPIVKRVIHTTADFDYANIIKFLNDPIESAKKGILEGCKIYCDTNMIVNGLNKATLKKFNMEAYCLVADPDVARESKERGVTRSIVGMERAAKDEATKIFLIGNAPTALFKLKEMIEANEIDKPMLVVGAPVGFVGAAESKEIFKDVNLPYITIDGRKGGSPVTVAIFHGILYQLYKREGY